MIGMMVSALYNVVDAYFVGGLGATKTILPYAREFAVIYITGSILNIFSVTMNNIVTSEGMVKLTMTSMLLSGILNIILNPILIYSLGFGIKGSAISTVISQALASILSDGYQPVAGYNYGAKNYDRVNGFIFILFGFEQVYMCLFLALGMGKEGGILSISRQGMFFIPAILVMPRFFGIEGVIWAQPAADLLTVILTALFMLGVNKKLNNFMNQKEYLKLMYKIRIYFDRENKIYFDYKLKVVISITRNAVYLVKLAGIKIKEINEVRKSFFSTIFTEV